MQIRPKFGQILKNSQKRLKGQTTKFLQFGQKKAKFTTLVQRRTMDSIVDSENLAYTFSYLDDENVTVVGRRMLTMT